ncbi:MAG: DUF1566 domain-containing protein, partial [Bacteroidota bacterium]
GSAAGGAAGQGGSGGVGGDGGAAGSGFRAWAEWPMPNQAGSGLPYLAKYTFVTVGADEVVRDEVTALVWQRAVSATTFTWQEAMDYCGGLTLAGWSDWRLPSRIELVSLLDLSQTNPAVNRAAFPGTPGDWFWTASPQAGKPANAWNVYFYFGYVDTNDVQNRSLARCVR